MNRKVTYARFHQSVYAPGLGELGNVLPPHAKTLDGLTMNSTDHGLIAFCFSKGVKHEFLIPSANIVLMALAPEEVGEKAKVVKAVA